MGAYEQELAQVRERIVAAAEQPVERFMSPDLASVEEKDSLAGALRCMVDRHVHRVVVLEPDGRLRGLVTTMEM